MDRYDKREITYMTSQQIFILARSNHDVAQQLCDTLSSEFETHYVCVDEVNDFDLEVLGSRPDSVIVNLVDFGRDSSALDSQEDYQAKVFAINTEFSARLAQYAFTQSWHLILFSTDQVFDGLNEQLHSEDEKPEPGTIYGVSKYQAEREIVASGVEYTILRVGSYWGRRSTDPGNMLNTIVSQLLTELDPRFFQDQLNTPLYVEDGVNAVRTVIKDITRSRNKIFNLAGDEALSPYEFVERINGQLNMAFNIQPDSLWQAKSQDESLRNHPVWLQLDNKLFKETFQFEFTPLDNGIADSLEGFEF